MRAIRVAYTGELGWELHHPIEMQNYLWDQLVAAGGKHGMKLVGARAQNWLRQEKSYRAFGTELGRDATPLEADLPRLGDVPKDRAEERLIAGRLSGCQVAVASIVDPVANVDMEFGMQVVVDLAVPARGADRTEVIRVEVLQDAGVVVSQSLTGKELSDRAPTVRDCPLQVASKATYIRHDSLNI